MTNMNLYETYRQSYIDCGFKEKNFDDRESKQPHQTEWEVILAGYLKQNNISLVREKDKLDFLGDFKGVSFYIEATAPQAGNGSNQVKDIPFITENFEDGIRNDNKIFLRFHNCFTEKIKQIEKKDFNQNPNIILAINGYECVKSWDSVLGHGFNQYPFVVRYLFGLGNNIINMEGHSTFDFSTQCKKGNKNIEISPLFKTAETPITGVIYSEVTKDKINHQGLSKEDFLYIQNPYKQDLSNIFYHYMKIQSYNLDF